MTPVIIHTVSPASWPQILTIVVAGAAFVLSCAALATQWTTWRRAGFRPTVQTTSLYDSTGAHFVVTVRNQGRVAGSIEAISFMPVLASRWERAEARLLRRPESLRLLPPEGVPGDLPHRLEPSASVNFPFPMASVNALTADGYAPRFRPEVTFGDAQRVLADAVEVSGKYHDAVERIHRATKARETGGKS